MNLHEYQGRELFAASGMPVLPGSVATNPDEVREAAKKLGGGHVVVKAQVHAGGRGKAGGVKLAENAEQATAVQEEVISAQADMIAELSTPLLPISDRVVVLPLIGEVNDARAAQVIETLPQRRFQRMTPLALTYRTSKRSGYSRGDSVDGMGRGEG